jgi:hypothetical protein
MTTPALMYGCKIWITTQEDKNKIQVAKLKFVWKVKGCTRLDKHQNKDTRWDLQISSLNNRIREYKHEWFQSVQQTNNDKSCADLMTGEARDLH